VDARAGPREPFRLLRARTPPLSQSIHLHEFEHVRTAVIDIVTAIRRDIDRYATAQAHAWVRLVDPWALLVERTRRDVDSPAAGARLVSDAYAQFITLTSRWPAADQDALVNAARPIFRVTVRVRRDLATAALASPPA
jgi:hypothetical protein